MRAMSLFVLAATLSCAAAACAPMQVGNTQSGQLQNTRWTIASVSGDALTKPGSMLTFRTKTFQARLPCSTVVGDFVQSGDALRTWDVRTIAGNCRPIGQEQYFAGKISEGSLVIVTTRGVTLQTPPDYIELTSAPGSR